MTKGLMMTVTGLCATVAMIVLLGDRTPRLQPVPQALAAPTPDAPVLGQFARARTVEAGRGKDAAALDARLTALEAQIAQLAQRLGPAPVALTADQEAELHREGMVLLVEALSQEAVDPAFAVAAEADLWRSATDAGAAEASFDVQALSCHSDRCLLAVRGASEQAVSRFAAGIPWDSSVEFYPAQPGGTDGHVIVERLAPALDEQKEARDAP
ncbi:MAG: hypothetical protein AAGH19_10600 [Pseudomonadota bacterium]